ncbi:MAG: exodeoxyribonuclease V subunit alpha [Rubrivivax sp.]|nr:exodeoxyribonuclease V subunit alpha [Rubrivivax sp.]
MTDSPVPWAEWDAARQLGLLRALDVELARFIAAHAPATPADLLRAISLLSRLEAEGHVCLDLAELARAPARVLQALSPSRERPSAASSPIDGSGDAILASWQARLRELPPDAEAARLRWQAHGTVCAGVGDRLPPHTQDSTEDPGAEPQTPLVLQGNRLYLRRYAQLERELAWHLARRARRLPARDAAAEHRMQGWLDRLFPPARMTGVAGAAAPAGVAQPDLQRLACERALRAGLTLITGGPGTGKTYTAARLLVLLQALHASDGMDASDASGTPLRPPLRVGLAAPTGKAAARLRQSIARGLAELRAEGIDAVTLQALEPLPPARTLHALLGVRPRTRHFAHDEQRPLPLDVLLVDEASMVHLELMAALLKALPPAARLVLLGDSEQLASVEAGSVLGELCAVDPGSPLAGQTVRLLHSHRFGGGIGQLAQATHAGDAAAFGRCLGDPQQVQLRRLPVPKAATPAAAEAASAEIARWALGRVVDSLPPGGAADAESPAQPTATADAAPSHAGWLRQLRHRPREREAFEPWVLQLLAGFERFRVLCALREGPRGVQGLNALIERQATAQGWLQARGSWYEGRPVMVTRNDPALRLYNGDIGLVLRAPAEPGQRTDSASGLRAWFAEAEGLRSVAVGRLPPVQTAFAMTVHKSQGSEFEHVLLALPESDMPLLTRELLYTGITRARRWLSIAGADDTLIAQALQRRTWRMSGLRQRLDRSS